MGAIGLRPRYAPEAFRQSRRYANAKRGQRPQLPLKAISPTEIATFSTLLLNQDQLS
ncbi:MAG: hypothetical protein F6K50_24590 [Moorea sp. SIO3I7]|uniref:hypothetical protein n=1 Tax=unclassified Moorena TaxID=2683338 RepID=UPI0013C0D0C5|nr:MULTISPECIES: hypothetical protein [unclassified Moorena]NEN98572.1 hypothetical protein [Moorena sp. SIO3I7]NEO09043.1 hypothetical protein [Moorena sp. SIO3I8]NEP26102.1 hypothetical protein [Moorena sp. SIO3I6]